MFLILYDLPSFIFLFMVLCIVKREHLLLIFQFFRRQASLELQLQIFNLLRNLFLLLFGGFDIRNLLVNKLKFLLLFSEIRIL